MSVLLKQWDNEDYLKSFVKTLLREKLQQVSRMFPSRTFIEETNVVPTEYFEFE